MKAFDTFIVNPVDSNNTPYKTVLYDTAGNGWYLNEKQSDGSFLLVVIADNVAQDLMDESSMQSARASKKDQE